MPLPRDRDIVSPLSADTPEESQARLRSLIDSALDSIIWTCGDRRIAEFNPAAERAFRTSRLDVLGRDVVEIIFPPEDRSSLVDRLFASNVAPGLEVIGSRLEATCMRFD